MCWSSEVTAIFCALETVVLLYLIRRNQHYDRLNAALHLPLLLQEFVQLLIWVEIDSSNGCTETNTFLSIVVQCIVSCVPFWFSLCVIQSLKNKTLNIVEPHRDKKSMCVTKLQEPKIFFAFSSFTFLIFNVFSIIFNWFGLQRCTTIGPKGHQIWPCMEFMENHWYWAIVMFSCWGFNSASLFLFQHNTLTPITFSASIWVAVTLFIVIGAEAGSFWCFQASTLCFIYLIEPKLVTFMEQNNMMYRTAVYPMEVLLHMKQFFFKTCITETKNSCPTKEIDEQCKITIFNYIPECSTNKVLPECSTNKVLPFDQKFNQ